MQIAIINGWAMPSVIWSGFCDLLSTKMRYESHKIIDIDRCLSVEQWVQYLDEMIEHDTLLIGWSLGGMLALEYVHRHPAKIRGLCTLQMNPKFVAAHDWPSAMTEDVFGEFKQLAASDRQADVKRLIKQFSFLVTAKGFDALDDLKALKPIFSVDSIPITNVLSQSLDLLESLDVRDKISTLERPQLHLLGEHDQLVPQSVFKQLTELNRHANVELIEGVSHLPCYSAAERIVVPMTKFAGGLS
ncbi:alpha/beta fold hydrolase [Alkalimarinus alittae]|uniref:Alpha/beta fold hydrolase n=1 Tax=Alkalimarinus alittae TaxID=2961619 RepID=A0ABY6N4Z9_9ALTE|nr:alpha/beta fold hydrolase [Alkalimarinus alittae]UZE97089.1 alpha/beta fold hydrolase [Alkalimarinus alittae]